MNRARPYGSDLLTSVWFWPSVVGVSSFAVATALLPVRPAPDSALAELAWPGDASSAASLLQTVAGAVMTATSLAFSLTVVALQLASQQFSPRLLREFARDRTIQAVLAVLVATFVVSLSGLRGIDPERPLPVLVLLLSFVLGLASIGALVAFVAHIIRSLRVNTMMVAVHAETRRSLAGSYAPWSDALGAPDHDDLPGPCGGVLLPLSRSGFVRSIRSAHVAEIARRHGLFLRLGVRPGDHVVHGAPLGSAWRVDGDGPVPVEDVVAQLLAEAVDLGYERTSDQDAALGFRQLVDIACKAISPGINDPTTCAEALGHCADLLVDLFGRQLGPQLHRDAEGVARVVTPDRDLRYYLDLSCAQVRRFGQDQPEVLTALLRLLRDCATAARDDHQRTQVEHQLALVLAQLPERLLDSDLAAVHDAARRVRLALAGDVDEAYRDRAGETRSV